MTIRDHWDRFCLVFGFRSVLKGTDHYGVCQLRDLAKVSFGAPSAMISEH